MRSAAPSCRWPAIPMLEALGDYKAPLLTGDTNIDLITFAKKNRDKYWNYFQVDPPEIYYGRMFPKFLEKVAAGGAWKPTNNKVHIIREQNNYNMQYREGSRGNASQQQVRARHNHRHPVPGAGLGPGDAGDQEGAGAASSCSTTGWAPRKPRSASSSSPIR